ncbi:hypothetical protein AB0E69_38675 [Kribbella sp. NPDC026611]|uniref:hypothetical protein n=1 Tax=Kribbella sp. NPDC026611 TaxID=3154911 RepID=UPI0033FC4062
MLVGAVALAGITLVQNAPAEGAVPPKPAGDYVLVCNTTHDCMWILRSVAEGEGDTDDPAKPAGHTKPVCQFGGAPQACTSALGSWSNSNQCYLQSLSPQPPYSDPAWEGHTDGAVWACVREEGYDKGKHLVTRWVWIPGRPDIAVVDPVTLAYQAIAQMHLAPPLIKTAPAVGQVGLVNMPVWLWVTKTESTWGPIQRSASVPGLTVTATAQVKAVNWSMGDGNTIRCEGPGTPYAASMGIKDSPTCGHRYKKTSSKLSDCRYPVTAVAQWDVTWRSTLGDSGEISMTQEAGTRLRIGEGVPVLVDPGGGAVVGVGKEGCR